MKTAVAVSPAEQSGACPTCGATVPQDPRFVSWCPACEWNLDPSKSSKSLSLFERTYLLAGASQGKRLLKEFQNPAATPSRSSAAQRFALALALLVHFSSFAFLSLAIMFFWLTPDNKILAIFGLFCLSIFMALKPQIPAAPKATLQSEDHPQLFRTIAKVQSVLLAKRAPHVVIDHEFNASFSHTGWGWNPTLTLGYPLLHVLSAEEKVWLISHELAHGANADPTRGFLIGSAIHSLNQWYHTLAETKWQDEPADGSSIAIIVWLSGHLAKWFMRALSLIPLGLSRLLSHLLWYDSQRAEYLADRLACQIAGKQAGLSCLYKLNHQSLFELSTQQTVVRQEEISLWERLDRNLKELPAHELERLRRLMVKEDARLAATHPPTGHRIAAIEALPQMSPSVILSKTEADALETELKRFQREVESTLRDAYTNHLYF